MANINWWTVALLLVSNLIMLYAWYGHLKSLSGAPGWVAILVSWSIALLEYCLAVPANRLGSKTMSLEQLKITQEAIALLLMETRPLSKTKRWRLVEILEKAK